MQGFELGQEDARQLANFSGVAEIGLHEHFDAAATAGVAYPMASATATCMSKVNCSVARPESRCKCPVPAPKKILGGDECFELFFQKYAAVDEIGGVFRRYRCGFAIQNSDCRSRKPPLASLTLGSTT